MKTLILCSLLVNIGLASAYLWMGSPDAADSAPAEQPAKTIPNSTSERNPDRSDLALAWSGLPDDPEKAAATLDKSGIPPVVLRAILEAKLEQKREARRAELAAVTPPKPYWRAFMPQAWYVATMKSSFELREMERNDEKLVTSIVGSPEFKSNAGNRRLFGELMDEEYEAVVNNQIDFTELRALQSQAANIVLLEDDVRILRLLNEEQDRDLRAVLKPDSYERYVIQSSLTAHRMQLKLADFKPTEAEFRAIFPLQRKFDDQFELNLPQASSFHAEYLAAQKKTTDAIVEVLGPERGAAYRMAVK